MNVSQSYIRRYWFGIDDENAVADTILLMERDRIEQYKAALDFTEVAFKGVFSGITGRYRGRRLSVVYSIGPAHVADCVSFITEGFGPKQFVATGSIGGLATEMGDVVISNSCTTQDGYSLAMFPEFLRRDDQLGTVIDVSMPALSPVSQGVRDQISREFECEILFGRVFTVPAVSLEDEGRLRNIKENGYIALDLETGPFLASCRRNDVNGFCIHWVTDLPLLRSFYYQYCGDADMIARDHEKKHRQWLNMPRLILPILHGLSG